MKISLKVDKEEVLAFDSDSKKPKSVEDIIQLLKNTISFLNGEKIDNYPELKAEEL